jgi:hypothetical protein
MSVEIDGQTVAKITNVMGWMDDDPVELSKVAFCVTDFGRSNGSITNKSAHSYIRSSDRKQRNLQIGLRFHQCIQYVCNR